MKKILKIGCGCLVALILITVILIVIAESCSGPVSQPAQNVRNEDEFQLLLDESADWERKTAEVENSTAVNYLRDYCKKNSLRNGFDSKKQTFCRISSSEFRLQCPPSDKTFVMRHANQIRRAALKALLKNLDLYAGFLKKNKPTTEKIENGEKTTVSTNLKLRDIVYQGRTTAIDKNVNGNISAILTQSFQLFYKGNKLLEYVLDGQRENIFMIPMSVNIRGTLSETDRYSMLQPFLNLLISDGLPVVIEHTAYSWDEKHKRGQVALLLVYKVKPDKKDR